VEEYQQRVVAEKAELDGRLKRLTAFLASKAIESVALVERNRLIEQQGYMAQYSDVLGRRIAWFQE